MRYKIKVTKKYINKRFYSFISLFFMWFSVQFFVLQISAIYHTLYFTETLIFSTQINISGFIISSSDNLELENKLKIEVYNILNNDTKTNLFLLNKICQQFAIVLLTSIFTMKRQQYIKITNLAFFIKNKKFFKI